jgi:hypothetical protein
MELETKESANALVASLATGVAAAIVGTLIYEAYEQNKEEKILTPKRQSLFLPNWMA